MQINLLEPTNNLPGLVLAAERGEEVLIVRNGIPVAKIVKYEAPRVKSPGCWKSKVAYSHDWDSAETNAEIANLFHG